MLGKAHGYGYRKIGFILDKRDALRRDWLMKLIMDSDRSYDEIEAFLKGAKDEASDYE